MDTQHGRQAPRSAEYSRARHRNRGPPRRDRSQCQNCPGCQRRIGGDRGRHPLFHSGYMTSSRLLEGGTKGKASVCPEQNSKYSVETRVFPSSRLPFVPVRQRGLRMARDTMNRKWFSRGWMGNVAGPPQTHNLGRNHGGLVAVIGVLLLLAAAFAAGLAVLDTNSNIQTINRASLIGEQALRVSSILNEMEAAERGYVLTSDVRLLDTYRTATRISARFRRAFGPDRGRAYSASGWTGCVP